MKMLKSSQHYFGYCVKCGSSIICDTDLEKYDGKCNTDDGDYIYFCSNEECSNHVPICIGDMETPDYHISKPKKQVTKIQICASAKTKEETEKAVSKIIKLKDELDELYGKDYTVHSCLLPKHILKEMGFDSTLVDALINTFGDKYSTELENEESFDSCCKKLDEYRLKLSKKVDRLVIVSTTPLSKVAYELELFTENKVKVI